MAGGRTRTAAGRRRGPADPSLHQAVVGVMRGADRANGRTDPRAPNGHAAGRLLAWCGARGQACARSRRATWRPTSAHIRVGTDVAEREETLNLRLESTARCCGRRRHRQTNSVRVCSSPASRRLAKLGRTYFRQGTREWLRLHGKRRQAARCAACPPPGRGDPEAYLVAQAARGPGGAPLFSERRPGAPDRSAVG